MRRAIPAKSVLSRCLSTQLLLGMVPVGATLEDHISQYENMIFSSKIEDQWALTRRNAHSDFLKPQSAFASQASTISSDQIKVEWYLRKGPQGAALVLGELRKVGDPSLVDAALWGILLESTQANFFSSQASWPDLLPVYSRFLRAHPLQKALLSEAHGAWWLWILGKAPGAKDADDLQAVAALLKARRELHPIKKVEGYAFSQAMIKKFGDDESADMLVKEWVSIWGSSTENIRRVCRDYFESSKSQGPEAGKIAGNFMISLAEELARVGNFSEAAEIRSYSILLKMARSETIVASEFFEVANNEYHGMRWPKAYRYFSLGFEAPGMEEISGEKILEAKLRKLISASRIQGEVQVSVNDFEDLLEESFNSIYRDETLYEFAQYLQGKKQSFEAEQAWDWVRRYSFQTSQRLEAVGRLIDYKRQNLEKLTSSDRVRDVLLSEIEYSSSLAQNSEHKKKLLDLLNGYKLKTIRLNLNKDRVVKASLSSFEKKISGLR